MKVYVAGHKGLVGSAILRKLKETNGQTILCKTSKELDLRKQADTEDFFVSERPDQVFLAAAKVGGILANNTYKAEFIYDNMAIALNVIHSAYKSGVKKLLNLGSSCIYPKLVQQPMKEGDLLTGILESTNEPYSIAKIAAIKLCRYYNEQYHTNYISIMPTNLYGPGDDFNLESSHVLSALIRKFHLAKLLRERNFEKIKEDVNFYPLGFSVSSPMTAKQREFSDEASMEQKLEGFGITKDHVLIWGTGEPYREFLFVDDLADACIYLMDHYDYKDIGEFVNAGVGEDIKIKELAKLVREIIDFDGEIKHDLSKPDGMPRKLMDVSKIKTLGWEPKINLRDGIKKTYEWYLMSI